MSNVINLTKRNESATINLSKTKGYSQMSVGLGWDGALVSQEKPAKGFLAKIFGSENGSQKKAIDLDASIIAVDSKKKRVVDTVYFANLSNRNNSIVHSGDNRTGDGDGDDETITIKTTELPEDVDTLFVTIHSYSGENFNQVANAFCHVYDDETKEKLVSFNLTESSNHTALIMVRMNKITDNSWEVKTIGQFCNGRTVRDLSDIVMNML